MFEARKKNARVNQINVKFTDEEMQVLESEAKDLGYDKPNFIRSCIAEHFQNK